MPNTALAVRRPADDACDLVAMLRQLAASMTCSQVAHNLDICPGEAARLALENNVTFGGVEDKGAWPRCGAPPFSLLPPVINSTQSIFERAARERRTDPLTLAARCLNSIADENLFAAILDL